MWRWVMLAAAVTAAGCGSLRRGDPRGIGPGVSASDDAGAPAAAYLQCCAACHGRGGRGDGPVAASLKTRPADLTRLAKTHGGTLPRDEIVATVTGAHAVAAHGTREMPVWSLRFEPSGQVATGVAAAYAQRRVDAIVAYVESLQER